MVTNWRFMCMKNKNIKITGVIMIALAIIFILIGIFINDKSNKEEVNGGVSGANVIENKASEKYNKLEEEIDKIGTKEYGKNYGNKLLEGRHYEIKLKTLVEKNKKYKEKFINNNYSCDLESSFVAIYNRNGKIDREYNLECKEN